MFRAALLLCLVFIARPALAEAPPTLADAKAQFAQADRALNEAWAEVKKRLPEARFNELKGMQRDWVTFRDERAEVAGLGPDHAAKAVAQNSPAYFTTATRLSADRAAWLLRLARGEAEPLTGQWIDGQGGTVEIVKQKGRLLFDFNVVRGRSFDLGVLAGQAAWNDRIGWFSDRGRDPAKTDEANIAFIRRDPQLEVITANASRYHGKRAYFDGLYFKAASLDALEQAAVVKAGEYGKSSSE